MKRFLSLLLVVLLTGLPLARSDDNPFFIDTALDHAIQAGLNELYNLNFDAADEIFKGLKDQEVEHPMVAFGETSVHWWRLSVYVLESDPKESAAFLESVDRCMRLSKEKIKRGDPTGEGYLTLGGAEGLLGRWQAANREYLSAYFKGKSAYRNLRRALKQNPKMTDANMGLGIFDYFVATLPAVVRALAFLGQGGNPQKGLDELRTAGEHGNYSSTASWLFLVNIYSNLENKPDEALKILSHLSTELPKSPLLPMLKIVAFYNQGSIDEMAKEAASFQTEVDQGTFRPEFRTQALFAQGLVKFRRKNWEGAVADFTAGLKAGTSKDPFWTWTCLYRGYAEDLLGQRTQAKSDYNTVLKNRRRWGSHDNAHARLEKPFTPDALEMKKLIL